ncbi:hypothetical protein ACVW1A_005653 [Bradyrhizobium sp. LB1.3]
MTMIPVEEPNDAAAGKPGEDAERGRAGLVDHGAGDAGRQRDIGADREIEARGQHHEG